MPCLGLCMSAVAKASSCHDQVPRPLALSLCVSVCDACVWLCMPCPLSLNRKLFIDHTTMQNGKSNSSAPARLPYKASRLAVTMFPARLLAYLRASEEHISQHDATNWDRSNKGVSVVVCKGSSTGSKSINEVKTKTTMRRSAVRCYVHESHSADMLLPARHAADGKVMICCILYTIYLQSAYYTT